MIKTLKNAWGIPELRKKLMFTLLILLIYRIGNVIPVPFVDGEKLTAYFNSALSGTVFQMMNTFAGQGLSTASLLALGIQPYINASIIIQLLTIALPPLERWAKEEGEEGKKKINMLTRISTVALGLIMGFAYYMMLANQSGVLEEKGFWVALTIILTFTAGSTAVMWLGEQITEHGIGNGISMILFANIIGGLPNGIKTMSALFTAKSWWIPVISTILMAALIIFVVFINDAERRIPIQYAKRVVGRKVYGGQSTNMPIKVAMSGVMPVIFAQSICSLPATFMSFFGVTASSGNWWYDNLFSPNCWVYIVFYGLMIFFFSWFYASIQYDPVEIANNLKKNGGFIPGFRPGKPTADFIKRVIAKIVIFGAVYLAVVALLPILSGNIFTSFVYANFTSADSAYSAVSGLAIGGTSVIIVVGVALETVKALEAQMLMRHYKGFLD